MPMHQDPLLVHKFEAVWLLFPMRACSLTHWGRVTHICVGNLTIIGSDNGLSPGRRQAITWTNVGILLIGPLGTNFSEMLIEIHKFSFKKIHLKMSSGKWRPFCLGLNVLSHLCYARSQTRLWCLPIGTQTSGAAPIGTPNRRPVMGPH